MRTLLRALFPAGSKSVPQAAPGLEQTCPGSWRCRQLALLPQEAPEDEGTLGDWRWVTGIWKLGVGVLGTSDILRPQLTPLVSAAGVRFPGVGVLPGVPTGAGVKPKAPGRAPRSPWNTEVGSGLPPTWHHSPSFGITALQGTWE